MFMYIPLHCVIVVSAQFKGHIRYYDAAPVEQVYVEYNPTFNGDAPLTTIVSEGTAVVPTFDAINCLVLRVTEEHILDLEANPNVIGIEPDEMMVPDTFVPDEDENLEPTVDERRLQNYYINAVDDIQASQSWVNTRGDGVVVCVVDSGVSLPHSDLITARFDGLEIDQRDAWNADLYGHGTHVSGIIAAQTSIYSRPRIDGASPDANIFVARVFNDQGNGVFSSTVLAAAYACQANGAQIINMSLGGNTRIDAQQAGYNDLWSKGVLIVASAGNNGVIPNEPESYPAPYKNVISVAATDSNLGRGYFSEFNLFVDIAAPGVQIGSTYPGNAIMSYRAHPWLPHLCQELLHFYGASVQHLQTRRYKMRYSKPLWTLAPQDETMSLGMA